MKKYINALGMILLTIVALTSCKEEEGTTPGTDGAPAITLYQYTPEIPEYDPDSDLKVRIATNNQVSEVYYLTELATEKAARIESEGENGYMAYVVENGKKVEGVSGASNVDVVITNIQGECAITIVGVNGNKMASKEILFTGLAWTDVATGTYTFGTTSLSGASASVITGLTSMPTTLQVCTTDPKLYRFKDVFGKGYNMKINLMDIKGTDENGEYQLFRVPATPTPFTNEKYGAINICDIGNWQGDDAFATNDKYKSYMYTDHSCFICVAHLVSAGNLGFGYDQFTAD